MLVARGPVCRPMGQCDDLNSTTQGRACLLLGYRLSLHLLRTGRPHGHPVLDNFGRRETRRFAPVRTAVSLGAVLWDVNYLQDVGTWCSCGV